MTEEFEIKEQEADEVWVTFELVKTDVENAEKQISDIKRSLAPLKNVADEADTTAKQAQAELKKLDDVSGSNGKAYSKILSQIEATQENIANLKANVESARKAVEKKSNEVEEQLKRTKEAKKKAQEAALMAKQATEESNESIKMLSIIKQAVGK